MTLTFIDLFAGIGGFSLGLERAGLRCVAHVEIDNYATKILSKHWPDVPKYGDVRSVGAHNLPYADVICGGFPCQDVSHAGSGAGLDGARSGLWREFYRIICELRPRFVIVENVAALLGRGLSIVLGDLARCGYDADWSIVPACALGAPHTRERVFIVAYTNGECGPSWLGIEQNRTLALSAVNGGSGATQWLHADTRTYGVADGVPARVDRLRGLGNAIVPQVAELVGYRVQAMARALMATDAVYEVAA